MHIIGKKTENESTDQFSLGLIERSSQMKVFLGV